MLLHEKTRRSWGIDITNNVLVLDEAHNLLQALSSVYSADISRDQLSASVVLIRAYIDRFRLRFRVDNLMLMRQLLALTVAFDNMLNAYANRNQSAVLTVAHFLTEVWSLIIICSFDQCLPGQIEFDPKSNLNLGQDF